MVSTLRAPRFQATSCPLCGETFDTPGGFRDHLFYVHDLLDDEGTETTLAVAPEPEPEPEPVATKITPTGDPPSPAAFSAAPPVSSGSWQLWLVPALVLAVVLELLVGIAGLNIVSDDAEATHVATAPTVPATVAPTASTTVPAPVHNPEADQRFAEKFAPKASDFPAGWTELSDTAIQAEDGGDDGGDAFSSCASNIEDPIASAAAGVDLAFGHDPSNAFGAAAVVADEATAANGLAAVRQVTNCVVVGMEQELKASLPRGVTFTHGAFTPLGWTSSADETVAQSMNITVVGPGGQFPLRVDVLGARKDRALFFLFITVVGTDPMPAQEKAMLASIVGRMQPTTI
jgi:hypothetical protein